MGEVLGKIQDAYKDLIQYVGGNDESDYFTAITPILTLGGVSFSYFDIDASGVIRLNDAGISERPIYEFSGNEKYEPQFCDMPLLFVLAYALAMAKRARDKKRAPGPFGLLTDWFQESMLNWPAAKEYLQEYDSILQQLREERLKGTFAMLNKAKWLTLG